MSSGHVRLLYDPETELRGKHILLVEDIVDTGKTLNRLVTLLRERDPQSLEICALLHKHVAEHLVLEPVYVGFDAPRVFLDRKSTRLNSSHLVISYAVFCLKKKK